MEWSYDLLHADEKTLLHQIAVHRGGSSLPSLVAVGGSHGLDEATVTHLLEALVDKSIVSVSFPGGDARYTLLDTVRDYALERLREAGERGSGAARPCCVLRCGRGSLPRRATRGRLVGVHAAPGARQRQLLGGADMGERGFRSGYRDAAGRTVRVVLRLGRTGLGGTAIHRARTCVDRRRCVVELQAEALATLRYLATEELDLAAAVAAGERALAIADGPAGSAAQTMAQITLALAMARSGDPDRAATLADDARRGAVARGDDWGAAAGSLVRAQGAAVAGDVDTVTAMADELIRHAGAIEYEAFLVPGALLEGWVAERRSDRSAAEDAYQRVLVVAERAGFADHAAFAFAGLGSTALAHGDPRRAGAVPSPGAHSRRGGQGALGRRARTR